MMKAGTVSPMRNVNFSDVPKDHWAYQYVKSLADRGYLMDIQMVSLKAIEQ